MLTTLIDKFENATMASARLHDIREGEAVVPAKIIKGGIVWMLPGGDIALTRAEAALVARNINRILKGVKK